ncbi:hypothetical protein [Coleofasciculus sp. E2-BRE-01]|uniref:hypothetical protein n=1 Tax=Coleofasciculus sp. E2-BRE-01 TaxID=3069524 RepID=UPI003303B15E
MGRIGELGELRELGKLGELGKLRELGELRELRELRELGEPVKTKIKIRADQSRIASPPYPISFIIQMAALGTFFVNICKL